MKPSFHEKLLQKEKNKLLLWIYAWRLSDHLWFNGWEKSSVAGLNETPVADAGPNYQLANELHRQIIRKFKRRKVYSSFRDNIWGVDLADMQSLSEYNKGIKYLLCAIDLFCKYGWVVPLKDKRGISIINAFHKIVSKGCKPNKVWVDQGGESYNNLFRRF